MLKKPSRGRKLVFGLFGLSCLLVKQDQLDEQNKPDEPDQPVSLVSPVARARSLSIVGAGRKVEGTVYAAKQGVV